MRYSKMFGKTLRDKPRNADSESHQLLLRGGCIRYGVGGGFLLMPLGRRVMARIEALVDAEMRVSGAAIPVRLVMSKRTGGKVEQKARDAGQGELLEVEEVERRFRC